MLALTVTLAIALRVGYGLVWIPLRDTGHLELPTRLEAGGDPYAAIARNIIAGEGYVVKPGDPPDLSRAPLYPAFLVMIYSLVGVQRDWIVVIAQSFIEGLTCLLVYGIAKKVLANTRVALVSALIYALYLGSIRLPSRLVTEPLYIFLTAVFIWYLVKLFDTLSLRKALVTGILLGIMTLCRPITLLFPLFIIIGLLMRFWRDRKGVLRNICVSTFAMLITVSPWIVRDYIVSGRLIPITTRVGVTFWGGTRFDYGRSLEFTSESVKSKARDMMSQAGLGDSNSIQAEDMFIGAALDNIREHPQQFVLGVVEKAFAFWYLDWARGITIRNLLHQVPLLLLGTVGLAFAYKARKNILPFLLLTAYLNLVYAAFHARFRYCLSVMPYVIIFAVYGALELAARWKRT
jgi:4-amino-4-deoxy-L-arabinose transferase-like glycosyltransferase